MCNIAIELTRRYRVDERLRYSKMTLMCASGRAAGRIRSCAYGIRASNYEAVVSIYVSKALPAC